jgi:serine/threonine protein kinase
VDYAHQQGIVHGDLKPSNIVFNIYGTGGGPPGQPKVRGFGLSSLPKSRPLTPGDVAYMAPEVAQGQPPNERSDIYSLGVLLYEICTGTIPFQGDSPEDIMNQHIQAAPPPPALINPRALPNGLVARCRGGEGLQSVDARAIKSVGSDDEPALRAVVRVALNQPESDEQLAGMGLRVWIDAWPAIGAERGD